MPAEPRIEGVILAAGSSVRAGTFKPALSLGGKPMIERCIEGMRSVCRRIIVVGGYELDHLRLLVKGLDNIECIQNISYHKGMFTSVKTGLSHVRGERCFVLPADIPLVPHRIYERLLLAEANIVVPSFQGKNGHPVLCTDAIIPDILREPDESSFRDVLRKIGFATISVDAEEILIDVDTREDCERIQRRFVQLF